MNFDILKEIGLKSGSKAPGRDVAGSVTREQLLAVANIKMPDLTAADEEAAIRTVAGSARSMGLEVKGL